MINKLRRRLFKLLNIRPSSEPFISGDTFRKHSDYVIESIDKIDVSRIKEKNVVFVNSSLLIYFFTKIHPKIRVKYILISHNSDANITSNYKKFIDDKIIHWYSQNLCFKSEKVSFLPIGIENARFNTNGIVSNFLTNKYNKPHLNKILVGFSLSTNFKSRANCFESLKNGPNTLQIENKLSNSDYFEMLKSTRFVASPEGNGFDCHRTWEAIYLNCIPVLLKYNFTKNLINLPVLILDDWKEFNLFSEEKLNKLYYEIISKDKSMAYFEFWKNKIFK